ncbi:MAG: hypothetical protein MJD61_10180 [Proteobacteria bacterium]|nr:hypothetical protein [Pseudomonadota bacterium]
MVRIATCAGWCALVLLGACRPTESVTVTPSEILAREWQSARFEISGIPLERYIVLEGGRLRRRRLDVRFGALAGSVRGACPSHIDVRLDEPPRPGVYDLSIRCGGEIFVARPPVQVLGMDGGLPCSGRCPDAANASGVCVAGYCTVSCEPGYEDCDGLPANGCERSLGSISDCGGCGIRCDDGDPCTIDHCNGRQCVYTPGPCDCVKACPGGDCGVCTTDCTCNQTCSAEQCQSTCASGAQCSLACVVGRCEQTCRRNAQCSLDCRESVCELHCQPGASCLMSGCGKGSPCQLRCQGKLRSCGGGVKVCNRACP